MKQLIIHLIIITGFFSYSFIEGADKLIIPDEISANIQITQIPIQIIQKTNNDIIKLINEAVVDRKSHIDYAEMIKSDWKLGKNVERRLKLLSEGKIPHKNSENFVAWMRAGGKKVEIPIDLEENSYERSSQINEELQKYSYLNSILQQGKREIFAIEVIARFAAEEVNQKYGIAHYYMRIIGKEGRYDGGRHTEGVIPFFKWISSPMLPSIDTTAK